MSQQQTLDLFATNEVLQSIVLPDADILYGKAWLNTEQADDAFQTLLQTTDWQETFIQIAGKQIKTPRLTAWHGDETAFYHYSGLTNSPLAWNQVLQNLKNKVAKAAKASFNSVLLNLYRHGQDSVSWHADDEVELGKAPIIASLSLGASRRFMLKHRVDPKLNYALDLHHGDLLIMQGEMQHHWLHQIAKTQQDVAARINLTFRLIQV